MLTVIIIITIIIVLATMDLCIIDKICNSTKQNKNITR